MIVELDKDPFELLVGAVHYNWACIMKCEKGFRITMEDADFYALRKLLQLESSSEKFTSSAFIRYMATHCPTHYSGTLVDPEYIARHSQKCRHSRTAGDDDKTVFIGWNDHIKDGRTAQNFEKTRKYFGKMIADHCKEHNISSMWTTPDMARERKPGSYPPGYSK